MSEEDLAAPEKELSDAVDEVLSQTQEIADPIITLTADLQRLQAEYANYRKRVDRDRAVAAEFSIAAVLAELLPVLDDLDRAAEHGELTGGFKAVADRITATVERLGLTKFADAPVAFNPEIHEALTHDVSKDVSEQPPLRFYSQVINLKSELFVLPE